MSTVATAEGIFLFISMYRKPQTRNFIGVGVCVWFLQIKVPAG